MSDLRPAKWYFDFVSPFAYFHLKLLQAKSIKLQLEPVPVLFAGLLKAWGTKGPAEVPQKRVLTYRHCTWFAAQHHIPFRFPPVHPFNPLRALRLVIAVGPTIDVVARVFDVIFKDGNDPNSDDGWRRVREALGVEDADALISDERVKAILTQNTAAAVAAGIFGVPTIELDGELFWGSDSIPMMQDFMANPALFRSAEMVRVSDLPVGTARRS